MLDYHHTHQQGVNNEEKPLLAIAEDLLSWLGYPLTYDWDNDSGWWRGYSPAKNPMNPDEIRDLISSSKAQSAGYEGIRDRIKIAQSEWTTQQEVDLTLDAIESLEQHPELLDEEEPPTPIRAEVREYLIEIRKRSIALIEAEAALAKAHGALALAALDVGDIDRAELELERAGDIEYACTGHRATWRLGVYRDDDDNSALPRSILLRRGWVDLTQTEQAIVRAKERAEFERLRAKFEGQ